ncbi:C2 domain [Dillenia turbinata]|uniref:C2 domain n=1 Tax=Dillenia turbinata TaxID=194707 RepID=A0AAN8VZ65_9MAGN
MDSRKFEMKVISACEVANVRSIFDVKVYAVIQVAGKPATKRQTAVDHEGGTNPKWNFSLTYWMLESQIHNNDGAKLEIYLYCQRSLGDRLIGSVSIPFSRLFIDANGKDATDNYWITKESVQMGKVTFWYKFGDVEKIVLRGGPRRPGRNGSGGTQVVIRALDVAALSLRIATNVFGVDLPFDEMVNTVVDGFDLGGGGGGGSDDIGIEFDVYDGEFDAFTGCKVASINISAPVVRMSYCPTSEHAIIATLQSIIPKDQRSITPNAPHTIFRVEEYNATVEFLKAPLLDESNSDFCEWNKTAGVCGVLTYFLKLEGPLFTLHL